VTLKPLPKESDGHKIAKALSCGGGVGRVVGFTPGWVVVAPPLAAVSNPGSAEAEAGAQAAAKSRAAYSPARLWYRLKLDFQGSLSGRSLGVEGNIEYRRDASWHLRSNGAVRVSLMCSNRKLSPEPFFRTETVRRGSAARRPGRRLREQGLE